MIGLWMQMIKTAYNEKGKVRMQIFTKWVATWANATSIIDQIATRYAKNLTLRYPVTMCFNGSALRFRFSNLTGTEPVAFTASVAKTSQEICNGTDKGIDPATIVDILQRGNRLIRIEPGQETVSDTVAFDVHAGEKLSVSIFIEEATQMNSGVLITGPLSKGFYSYGNMEKQAMLPLDLTRNTHWFYFLNTIDVLTEEQNHCLICYGDSITAQSWPDYLQQRVWNAGVTNISVVRRAVSGTKILRQYDCITYQAYGLKGATRFPIEMNTSGADAVLIQHGINDIIHPVGEEVNIFRPWSDLPTVEAMTEGFQSLYIQYARKLGMKVYGGTLLPIYGWRTYASFRNEMKDQFNQWLRTTDLLDGCVDFDAAVRAPETPERFAEGFDSGDHLHPSEAAYQAMANAVPDAWLKSE